jgi:hypothetical protein
MQQPDQARHRRSRASGSPGRRSGAFEPWVPAFAGMTERYSFHTLTFATRY